MVIISWTQRAKIVTLTDIFPLYVYVGRAIPRSMQYSSSNLLELHLEQCYTMELNIENNIS